MSMLQELSKLIPRGLLVETASDISAARYDKLVSRFEQGFGIDQIASMMRVGGVSSEQREQIFDEILSNKDAVVKRALEYLKDDDISALKQLMYYSKRHGYD